MGKQNRFGQAHVLTRFEESRIRMELKEPHRTMFEIAMFTGERWGAILQLKISDVYDDRGQVREYITFRGTTRKSSAGTKAATRQVFLHPTLCRCLSKYSHDSTGWLFPSPTYKSKPYSFNGVYQCLKSAVERCGYGHLGISTHSTRRTFITRLAESGVPIKDLMSITGHKNVETLMLYIDGRPDVQKAAILSL